MGIEVTWDNDQKTIVRHTYKGQWTVSDFYKCVDESAEMLQSVDHPVDLIIDMLHCDSPPQGIIPAYQYADRRVPENQRLIVMVQIGVIRQAYDRIVDKIAPRAGENRHQVETLDEAYAVIAQYQALSDS